MKINWIKLENIRSYKEQEVKFPVGNTLLSGDIGSGKTSVLLSIEFALFGLQPGQKGNSLLKNGEEEGGVTMEFEIDGNSVVIERRLKRAKNVSQSYCSIEIDGEKKELSVTEVKDKVLELLNYPKEFSKKQNLLYKFTVYTPQEEMKQIILQDPDTRVNTLRHVFGVDKYKKILENVSIIAAKIREEKRLKEGMTLNLEKEKEELINKKIGIEEKKSNLVDFEKIFGVKKNIRDGIQIELNELSKRREEKIKLEQEVEKSGIMISNKNDSIVSNKNSIQNLNGQIAEVQKLEFDESKLERLHKEIEENKKKVSEYNGKMLELSSQVNSLKFKNEDNEKIKEKLVHIEVCPTCLQDVNEQYKNNVVQKMDTNSSENLKKVALLNSEKEKLDYSIQSVENLNRNYEKEIQDLNVLKLKLESLEEKKKLISELEERNISIEKDIQILQTQMDELRKFILEMQKYGSLYEDKRVLLDSALNEERLAEIKVAELKKEIDFFWIRIQEFEKKISEGERVRNELNYLGNLENWLSEKFVPLISRVEKNVMAKLKQEFSNLFSEWFGMLVSDNFNVHLDEDFTPIIEQQDYELDYNYLSGGERTAIALAYRLSLNQVINSMLSKIKTRDFVILDEPTDGFSDQQLDKMRDVLQELNVGQLIIVSHEQKIESFVENIVRFEKVAGTSGIAEISGEETLHSI